MKRTIYLAVAVMLFAAESANAVQLGIYEFTGSSTGDNQFNAVTAQPTGGTFSTFTRTNVNWSSAANVFNSTAWNVTSTIDTGEYIQFSLTVAPGYAASITDLSFFQQGSSTVNDEFEVRYSTDGFTGFTTRGSDAVTVSPGASETWDFADVALSAGQTISFRWFVYGDTQADGAGTPSASGTFRVDNVALNGEITLVPEPSSLAMLVFGMIGMLRFRGRAVR